ncbi:MAG: diaminopimelate decarboxylase [Candidatus Muproteobacteria bacterium RBG_16_64_11]|uniref:Diaminopimelate decarboxylase n=1 Tax=Candidatus Muproteobacteria bacterium RBG_16_64_11 TaxID=1817758 RepID=A0A1F6TEV1_9PROT|nr:MAG: diaminopimelate decarboxylase [Candidatus Muproteobacteria bacterium RBG_16_64_11]
MSHFDYRGARLYAEGVALADIAAQVGTPCYVYSRAHIDAQWRAFDEAFGARPHLVCYSVKANSNLALLNCLARLGSGFDIVSGGELERVLAAGGDPAKIVFSGIGKGAEELRRALQAGIHCFNVESAGELERLNEIAGAMGRPAPVSLRVNPDVDAKTHPYIATGLKDSKFGVPMNEAHALYRHASALPHIRVVGVDCHIGSQLTDLGPFADAVARVLALVDELTAAGITLDHVDFGGGLGIRYRDETPPAPQAYVEALLRALDAHGAKYRALRVLIEPGRAIVGNAGVLLTRVEYLKPGEVKNFAIVDAAMNDLMRPALYDAWQEIVPVQRREGAGQTYDVVGPVCESGDFLGRDRALTIEPGDLLAIRSAGAYGSVMSSNYNTRPRAAEVMVDGERFHVVRRRETVAELLAPEALLPG